MSEDTKWCPRCSGWVAVTQFGKNSRTPDGLFGYCKPCQRSYARERYESKRDEINETNRKRYRQERDELHRLREEARQLRRDLRHAEKLAKQADLRDEMYQQTIQKWVSRYNELKSDYREKAR